MKRMMWTTGVLLLFAGLAWTTPWSGAPVATARKAQTACPVMGFDIDRNIHADFKAKRIYFCCPFCPSEFREKPDFYMAEMLERGVVPEDAPRRST